MDLLAADRRWRAEDGYLDEGVKFNHTIRREASDGGAEGGSRFATADGAFGSGTHGATNVIKYI